MKKKLKKDGFSGPGKGEIHPSFLLEALFINGLTIYFASRVDLFQENISITMALPYYRLPVTLFMLMTACLVCRHLLELCRRWHPFQYDNIFIILGLVIFTLATLTPYHKGVYNIASDFHVYGSLISFSFLAVVFLGLIAKVMMVDLRNGRCLLFMTLFSITLIIGIILTYQSINGLSEILTMAASSWMLYQLEYRID